MRRVAKPAHRPTPHLTLGERGERFKAYLRMTHAWIGIAALATATLGDSLQAATRPSGDGSLRPSRDLSQSHRPRLSRLDVAGRHRGVVGLARPWLNRYRCDRPKQPGLKRLRCRR